MRPGERPAPAKPKPWAKGVSKERQNKANERYARGNQFFVHEQFAQALEEYEQAVKAWDHPAIRYNMAVCLIRMMRPVEAYHCLLRALRFGRAPLGNQYQQAQTYKNLLLGQIGRLKIVCREAGARVTLDGQPILVGPGEHQTVLKPGLHQVVAKKPGFITTTRDVSLFPGKVLTVELKLLPLKSAVKMVRRWKRWMPWTVFAIGGVVAALGVPLILKAADDYNKYDKRFDDACSDLPAGGCSSSEIPQDVKDLGKRADAMKYSSYVLFALGGAAAAAGTALIILNQPRAERQTKPTGPGLRLGMPVPAPVPGGAVVTWGGRF